MTRRRKQFARVLRAIRRARLRPTNPARTDDKWNDARARQVSQPGTPGERSEVLKPTACRSWSGLSRARAMVDSVCRSARFLDLTDLTAWAAGYTSVRAV